VIREMIRKGDKIVIELARVFNANKDGFASLLHIIKVNVQRQAQRGAVENTGRKRSDCRQPPNQLNDNLAGGPLGRLLNEVGAATSRHRCHVELTLRVM